MMYISVYPVVITMRHSNVYEERSLGIYSDDEPAMRRYATPDHHPTSGHATGTVAAAADPAATPGLRRRRNLPRHLSTTFLPEIGHTLRRTLTPWHGVGVPPPPPTTMTDEVGPPESRISFISHQIQGQLAHDLWMLVLAVLIITTIETSNFLADPVTYSVFNVVFEVVSAYGCVGISVGLPSAAYSFSGGWHSASKIVLCAVMLRGRHRGLPVALDRAVRLPGEQLGLDEEEDYRIRRSLTGRRMSLDV